jgi:hypothetical protein
MKKLWLMMAKDKLDATTTNRERFIRETKISQG